MIKKTKTTNVKQTKKKKQTKKSKQTKQKYSFKLNRVSIFTVLLLLAIIAVVVGIYFGIRWATITVKYKKYTDKMNEYGYSTLYNNDKASAVQSVTNEELLKVAIGAIKNKTDISKLYYTSTSDMSENNKWLKYAESIGVAQNINSSNLNNKATKIDSIIYVVNLVERLLRVEIEQANLKMKESKLSEFTEDEQRIIAKAVTLGLIKNSNSGLSNNPIIKGELNKLVITIVEKYATVYYKTIGPDNNGNIVKQDVNLVTTNKDKPKNYKEYPYIVDNIEKEIYELDYNILTKAKFKTPKEVYKTMGYLYSQTDEMLTKYFNAILNVDYNTITNESFLNSIKNQVVYALDKQDVEEYVNYVKENKIKLEGSATPLLPIMYNNGEQYVIRTKVEFKVISSNTTKNLLYGDNSVEYNSKEIVMYVDVPTGMTLNSKSLRVYISCLADNLSTQNADIIK